MLRFFRKKGSVSEPDSPARPLDQSEAPKAPVAVPVEKFASSTLPSLGNLPGSDPEVLAEIGLHVANRLDDLKSAVRIKTSRIDMYAIPAFLSETECVTLMALIDQDVKPSIALRGTNRPSLRTSETCRLSATVSLVAEVEQRISDTLGLDNQNAETIQGQRYSEGQRFGVHNDYIAAGQSYSEVFAREGGQRTWTAMIYLNQPQEGGFTNFPFIPINFPPRAGVLLTWNNMNKMGLPNRISHHEGQPVVKGRKYVLTKWYRERQWFNSDASDALRR